MNLNNRSDIVKIIGLTGGIGSGKSTVSQYLLEKGIEVIDADQIGKDIVEPGMKALSQIAEVFGENVIKTDGSLDREKLGSIVFGDKDQLEKLNSITLNIIKEEIRKRVEKSQGQIIFIDAAILIETNLHEEVDLIWLVSIDQKTQLDRVKIRNQMDETEIINRINSQMTNEERKAYADVILDNSGTIEMLYEQVDAALEKLI